MGIGGDLLTLTITTYLYLPYYNLQSTTYNTIYNTTALTPTNIQYTWTPDRRRGTTKKKCSKYSFVNGFPALYYGRLDSRPLDS